MQQVHRTVSQLVVEKSNVTEQISIFQLQPERRRETHNTIIQRTATGCNTTAPTNTPIYTFGLLFSSLFRSSHMKNRLHNNNWGTPSRQGQCRSVREQLHICHSSNNKPGCSTCNSNDQQPYCNNVQQPLQWLLRLRVYLLLRDMEDGSQQLQPSCQSRYPASVGKLFACHSVEPPSAGKIF